MFQTAPLCLLCINPDWEWSTRCIVLPAQAGGTLVSTGRQFLPKILPQLPTLCSPHCSNLCCSFAADRRETDCRCNPRWGELLDTQSSLKQPVVVRGTTCFFHFSLLTSFLILASNCPLLLVAHALVMKKIPTPL